jgi:hypothetical protein
MFPTDPFRSRIGANLKKLDKLCPTTIVFLHADRSSYTQGQREGGLLAIILYLKLHFSNVNL